MCQLVVSNDVDPVYYKKCYHDGYIIIIDQRSITFGHADVFLLDLPRRLAAPSTGAVYLVCMLLLLLASLTA